jgi:hypothetical protein
MAIEWNTNQTAEEKAAMESIFNEVFADDIARRQRTDILQMDVSTFIKYCMDNGLQSLQEMLAAERKNNDRLSEVVPAGAESRDIIKIQRNNIEQREKRLEELNRRAINTLECDGIL